MRVMIDTMIHDKLVADASIRSRLVSLVVSGKVALLTSHIQQDQLVAIPDAQQREPAIAIPADRIATKAAVWDVSRWDEAEWGTPEANAAVSALASGNPKHLPDALIGVTAASAVDVLVTEDNKLTKRLGRVDPALQVLDFDGFKRLLHTLVS